MGWVRKSLKVLSCSILLVMGVGSPEVLVGTRTLTAVLEKTEPYVVEYMRD